jgi:hypothetical protein
MPTSQLFNQEVAGTQLSLQTMECVPRAQHPAMHAVAGLTLSMGSGQLLRLCL